MPKVTSSTDDEESRNLGSPSLTDASTENAVPYMPSAYLRTKRRMTLSDYQDLPPECRPASELAAEEYSRKQRTKRDTRRVRALQPYWEKDRSMQAIIPQKRMPYVPGLPGLAAQLKAGHMHAPIGIDENLVVPERDKTMKDFRVPRIESGGPL